MQNEFQGIPCPNCGKKGLKFVAERLFCCYCGVQSKVFGQAK
jgi:hypothetical protein